MDPGIWYRAGSAGSAFKGCGSVRLYGLDLFKAVDCAIVIGVGGGAAAKAKAHRWRTEKTKVDPKVLIMIRRFLLERDGDRINMKI